MSLSINQLNIALSSNKSIIEDSAIPGLVIRNGKVGAKEQIADGIDERLRQRSGFRVVVIVVVDWHGLSPRRAGHRRPKEPSPLGVFENVGQDARQNPDAIHHDLEESWKGWGEAKKRADYVDADEIQHM